MKMIEFEDLEGTPYLALEYANAKYLRDYL